METVKDFRIGNIVNDPFHNIPSVVIGVTKAWVKYKNKDIKFGRVFSNAQVNLLAIRLTDDWFIKFGFEMNCGDWCLNGVRIGEHEENEGETTFKFTIHEIVSFNSVEIKYVHQLQNLYFSLTQNELNYKL